MHEKFLCNRATRGAHSDAGEERALPHLDEKAAGRRGEFGRQRHIAHLLPFVHRDPFLGRSFELCPADLVCLNRPILLRAIVKSGYLRCNTHA